MDAKKIILIIVLSFTLIFSSCAGAVIVVTTVSWSVVGSTFVALFGELFRSIKETNQIIEPLDNFVNEFHAAYNKEEYSEIYKASGEVKTRLTEEEFVEIFTEFTEKLGRVKNSIRNKVDISKKSGKTVVEMVYQTSFSNATAAEKFIFIVNENKATLYSYDIKLIDSTGKENVENNFNSFMKNTNVFKFFASTTSEANTTEAQFESQNAGEEYIETAEFESQEATQ